MVTFPVRVVCNILARELIKFLAGRKTEEVTKRTEEIASWYREKKDLSTLLPVDFTIPDGIKGKITMLKNFPARVNGNCPAYDLILQNVYNAAGYIGQEMERAGDKDGAARMREVQVIAAFLGNDKVRPWYYENMDRFYRKIAAKVGVEDGRSAAGDAGNTGEEENA